MLQESQSAYQTYLSVCPIHDGIDCKFIGKPRVEVTHRNKQNSRSMCKHSNPLSVCGGSNGNGWGDKTECDWDYIWLIP